MNVCNLQLFANRAKTELIADISPTDTTLYIIPGTGDLFPDIECNQYFLITVENCDTGEYEIMKVVFKSSDTFTVIRGQEDTIPKAFPKGSKVELRITKGTLEHLRNLIDCFFQYVQTEPAAVWTIRHNLDCYPCVLLTDENDQPIVGNIHYIDRNTIEVCFNEPKTGKAILSSSDLSLRDKVIEVYNILNDIKDKYNKILEMLAKLNDMLGDYYVDLADLDPYVLLEKIKKVDGEGSGLDADLIDGLDSSKFARNNLENVNDEIILEKIKNVDGPNSGLDADFLDGLSSEDFYKKGEDIIPPNDITNNIGSDSKKWKRIFSQLFVGNLAGTATNSQQLNNVPASYYMRKDEDNLPLSDNLYKLGDANHRFSEVHAEKFLGVAYEAYYADIAEYYNLNINEPIPGLVVSVSKNEHYEAEICNEIASDSVIGVTSLTPGFVINSAENAPIPVAIKGKVLVKVKGKVKKGEKLYSYYNGLAIGESSLREEFSRKKEDIYRLENSFLNYFGYALENKETDEVKEIMMILR